MKLASLRGITDLNLTGKKVLVRADLDVPVTAANAAYPEEPLRRLVPTLQTITKVGGTAIVIGHRGRPGGKFDPELSLASAGERLKRLLPEVGVHFLPSAVDNETFQTVSSATGGEVFILENLRFDPGEKNNDLAFAHSLARYGEILVQDAAAHLHLQHASVASLPGLFDQRALGVAASSELVALERVVSSPEHPLCLVLGGNKATPRLNVLFALADQVDKVILGGTIATALLAAQGVQVGRSLHEHDLGDSVLQLLPVLARSETKLYLPVDFRVGPSAKAPGFAREVPAQEIPADMKVLDIGPASAILFREVLQTCQTIIWNGPMGTYENEDYGEGTSAVIEQIAASPGFKVAGGGDSCSAVQKMELGHKFDIMFPGSATFLSLLEGKRPPGLRPFEA